MGATMRPARGRVNRNRWNKVKRAVNFRSGGATGTSRKKTGDATLGGGRMAADTLCVWHGASDSLRTTQLRTI